jgi:hypothetical protein
MRKVKLYINKSINRHIGNYRTFVERAGSEGSFVSKRTARAGGAQEQWYFALADGISQLANV